MRKVRYIITVCSMLMMSFILSVPVFAEGDPSVSLDAVNGVPLVIVYVNENESDIAEAATQDTSHTYGNIQQMNDSDSHSVRCIGKIEIVLPETGKYAGASVPEGKIDLKFIRGRGNSTWSGFDKKPYKIEFKSDLDLFELGASKNWALMANYYDDTLMRNRITSWLGNEIGLQFTPQQIPVDFVMIGTDGEIETSRNYLGSYCLSELVDVEENRVNIAKLGKNETDASNITGGYLMAIYSPYQDKDLPASTHFTTHSGLKITNDTPEFESNMTEGRSKQRTYIRNYINELDDLIMKSDEITPEIHDQIARMMDLKSLADYWWVQEFSYNTDGFGTGSTYMYKDRGGKLCWGPLWDFDLAWTTNTEEDDKYSTGFNNTELKWTDQLREKDPEFIQLLKDRWNDENTGMNIKLADITKEGGLLDQYREEIRDTWQANYNRWYREFYETDAMADETLDLDQKTEDLRYWIEKRRIWVDQHLEEIGTVYYTLTYEADGEVICTRSAREKAVLEEGPPAPDKAGYVFSGWTEKDSGAAHRGFNVCKDTVFIANYVSESDAGTPEAFFFTRYDEWAAIDDDTYYNPYKIIPEDAVPGSITWSSSDTTVAEIDTEGNPVLKGIGKTTITAEIRNGISKSYVLHVFDPEDTETVFADGISVPDLTLKEGEYGQIVLEIMPKDKPHYTINTSFQPEDEQTVELIESEMGIIRALRPGKVRVNVTAICYEVEGAPVLSAECVVTVTGNEEDKSGQKDKDEEVRKMLPAPKLSTRADRKGKKMIVSLTAVNGAAGYKVEYRKAGSASWKTVSANGTKAEVKNMKRGGLYQLRAAAVDGSNEAGEYSAVKYRFYRAMKSPRFRGRKGSIKVAWKKSKGASGYQILIADNRNLKGAKVITVQGKHRRGYIIKDLKKGSQYYVSVRPYRTRGGKLYTGIRCGAKAVKVR